MTREEFLQRRYAEDRVEEAAREKKRASLGEGTRAGALPGAAAGAAAYNRLTGTSPMLSNDVGASRGPRGLAAGSDILAYQAQQERQAQQRARDMAAEELKRAITPRSGGVVHDGSYGGKLRTQGSSWQPEEAVAAPSPFLGRLSTGSDIMAQERERELAGLEALKRAAEEAAGLYEQAEAERRDSIMPIVSDLGAYTARQESERRLGELAAAKRNAEREYKDRARELGELPGLGERALKTLSGAGKQYLGSTWDAAGALMPNGTAMGQVYSEQLESLYGERQRTEEWLKSPEDEDERRQLENRLASLNEQIAVYEASARANAGVSAAARDAAAEITRSGAADIERAKTGASAGGRLLVGAGAAGAQMLGDIAIGAATGLGNMAPMMARSFGGGTQEAREKGYTQKQQIALGVSSAATEYLSEKLFGGNPVYDADAGLVSRLAGKLSHNDRLLEMLSSRPAETVYEGLEEIVSDLLNPVAEQIIAGRHDELTAEELITDGIVGMMLGGVGQGANAIGLPGTQKAGERAAGRFFTNMGGEAVSAVISEGMDSSPGTKSRTLAEQLKARLDAGEKISPAQLGRLYRANVEAIDAETAAGTAETANAQTEGHAYDGDLHGGVDTADMSAAQAAGNVKGDAGAENAVQAGRATTILNPYEGEKPQYTAPQNRVTPSIEGKSLADAETRISEARAREQNDGRSFRKNLTNLYEQIFSSQGGSRGIAVNGASMDGRAYVVTLNKGAIGKIISDKNISPQKLAVLDAIDDVIENGEYVGSGKYVQKGGKQKDTIRFDYFETPVVIDGQAYTVTFDVEVFPSTNNYRTHKVINEMDIVSNSLTDTGTHLPQGLSGQRPFTGDSIALNAEDVNAGAENKTDAPAAIKTGVPAQSGITGTAETSAPKIAQRSGGVKSGEKKDDGRLGPVGRKTARKFYNGGPADSYYAEFTAYYQAGLTGAGPETVRSSYAGTLNSAQRQAAYLAGQTDAQNRAGADTRSDSRSKAEPGAEKSGGTAAAENRGASPTDTRESGRRLNVDEETVRQAVRLSEATGRRIVFYEGAAGENGYYGGGTIHVNANSARPSAQIIAHELTHSIEGGEGYAGLSELVLRRIERQGGDLEALRREKAELYGRAGHPLESAAAVDAEIVAEYVERSLLTDERSILALAREDRTLAQRILGWLDRLLAKLGNGAAQERVFVRQAAELYRGALEQTAGEARPETDTARRGDDYLAQLGDRYSAGEISEAEYDRLFDEYYKGGSETAYSIERTTDNRPFVEVERDILAGVPKSQWVSVVKENLKKKFPDGITVGNNEIKINQQSRNEMTYSGYMQWLSSNNPAVHSDKLRATDNAGEMVRAATDWVNEGLNHPRRDSIADFARGSVLLRIGERDYSADVVVGTRKNGGMILYDVLNLQPASFTKKETDAVNTKNPSPEADSSTAPLSADTVAQSGGAVKGQGGKNPTGGARYSISETRDGIEAYETSEEIRRMPYRQRMEAFMDIMRSEYRGRTAKFVGANGEVYYAKFDGADLRKNIYGDKKSSPRGWRAKINTGADGNIFELIENARHSGSSAEQGKHTAAHRGLTGWEYFVKTVQIDGKMYDLLANVRKKPEGEYVYSIQLGESKNEASALPRQYQNGTAKAENRPVRVPTDASEATIRESGGDVKGQGGKNPSGGARYSISEDYAQEVDSWDRAGRPEGERFILGSTGAVLQGLGAIESDIYMNGDKISAILEQHTEMSIREIQRIPELLEDPTLILKSKGTNQRGQNTRLAIFGSIKAKNGQPVMCVLDIRPVEGRLVVNDMQKVNSAYTKNNPIRFIAGSEVMFADEKRTIPLLRTMGLQSRPIELQRSGSVGSISYNRQNVKLSGVPFSEVVGTSEAYEGRRYSVDESGAAERRAEAVERLPAKARGYLDRAERKLTRKIAQALSVPAAAQRTYLKDIAREISEQYLSDGRISDETINSLFERAYDRSGTARETRSAQDARDFKEWARRDFDSAIGDMLGELRTVRRWTQERQAKREAPAIESLEQVEQAYALLKDARRQSEKATAKNLLTEHDEALVSALLAGRMELRHLDPKTDNVRGVTEVYKARQEYERLAGQLRQWNASRRAQLREQADAHLKNANGWKDKKAGILYSRETMERNIRDIVKDSAEAESIIREYFTPVHEAQAESTRLKNRMRERVRALGLSTKETAAMKKAGKVSEAHAVQLLGEATDNIRSLEKSTRRMAQRDGKTLEEWRSVVRELWAQNPQLDRGKIEGAVEEFRRIYDELFRSMNEARIRNGYEPVNYRSGYFPHFQPGEGDGIMGLFGRALGIRTDVTALPTSINGLTHTFRPGIQWFGSAQERLGFNTVYDAVEGFDRYIEGVADVIYQTDNIQRLRALAQQIRYRTGDEGLRRQIDEIRADAGLSEEDRQSRIDRIHENGRFTLSNFVVELEEYTNLLANKKSGFDRGTERLLGRRIYNTVKGLEGRVAANMVAVNPGSWLTNFIPLTQGGAALGRFDLLSGMWDTLRAYISDDGFAGRSAFLTNRRGSDPLVRGWTEKASAALGAPMEIIDRFTADSLVRGRYRQNIRRGLSEAEAMREADGFVSGVMADRSKGSMPTFFESRNPAAKLVTQFQLEVNNQIGFYFKDLPRELRDRGALVITRALLRLLLGSWLFNEVYEFFVGRRPAVDPLGMLNDAAGDLTGWELPNVVEMAVGAVRGERPELRTEKTGAYTAAKNLAGDAAEQLPFIGGLLGGGRLPINSALPNAGKLVRAIAGEGWSAEKRRAEAAKALSGPASYLLLPFGGGQVKKAYQGIKAAAEGGSYTVDAEGRDILQFPVFGGGWETAKNAVQAAIFGKTSLSEGQEWVSSGFDSLSARETAAYQAMLGAGVRDRDAYGLIEQLAQYDHKADKFDILMGSGISDEGKGAAYYSLLAGESEREALDILGEAAAQAAADRVSRYGEISGELEALESFAGLEVEAREKALLNAWRLSEALALEEGSEGRYEPASGWMQWAAGGGDAGVSEAEAILFKAAYDMSSSDTDPETGKTVSGSKKKNTLELAGELLPGLSDTELEYLMSGFWKS